MKKTQEATRRRDVSDLTKMEELIRQNKKIETGYIIRQSMKYHNTSIRGWSKPKSICSKQKIKITSGQQLNNHLNQSIPKAKDFKDGFKIAWVRKALFDWLETTYHPTVFMTIQLPDHLKTEKADQSKEYLRRVMSYFERQLLGREWNEYHLPFVCFMEEGISGLWHYHILFNQGKFKPWHLWLALDNTLRRFSWPDYCMHLDIMNADKRKVISYCLKEVKVDINGHFDSNRFLFSDELFKWCN